MPSQNRILALLVVALALPVTAAAESWSCRHDNDVREVHVMQTTSAPVPCEVVYRKLTEGAEDQVLWNAQHDESYCVAKATEFVEQLTSWGWTCVETIRDDAAAQ